MITRFDNYNNPDWEQVYEHTKLNANQTVPFTVERAAKRFRLTIQVPATAKSDAFDLSDEGILPQYVPGPIAGGEVVAGSPAEKAGLRAGDAIVAVDGHDFHFVNTLRAYMQAGNGKPVALDGAAQRRHIPDCCNARQFEGGYILGFDSVPIPIVNRPLSISSAWGQSVDFFESNSLLVAEVLQRLFTHKLSVTQLMGPVGIAHAAGEAAETKGWFPKFGLAGEISLQLGILNLMPFPILDGGMILLLLIESLMRHDISIADQGAHLPGRVCRADGVFCLRPLQRREQAGAVRAHQAVTGVHRDPWSS